MDDLFPKYQQELVILRALCREYARRYPKVAARLQLGGEACDDPHVERLIQAVALLCARVTKRLDDGYPQFTEALLNLLFPHYLRPFPSCAIVRVAAADVAMPRGTRLQTREIKGVPYTFTTAYDVAPATIVLASARFDALIDAPPATRLPAGVTASISLVFQSSTASAPLSMSHEKMRLYIDGDPSFCAALRDALLMRTACAYVECDAHSKQGGPWTKLDNVPLSAVGFADDEALIPFGAQSHVAYRVLAEYFAFPEKFNFLDVDMASLLAHAADGATELTLHLALADLRPDLDHARLLASLSCANLLQGCTPVVNLFRQPGVPISFDQRSADYTVLAHGSHPQAFEVYSVDQVHMVQQAGNGALVSAFLPFYSLKHDERDEAANQHGRYWLMRHDETLALCSPGHEKTLSLVDARLSEIEVDRSTLSIELTCTNRDLPASLKLDALHGEGDLFIGGAKGSAPIRFLRRPTRPARLINGPDTQWRLISHLALNHHSLVHDGGAALREMLGLYDVAQSPVSRRQISGIVAVDTADTTAWIRHQRGTSLVYGSEVRLTIDEDAFVGAGLHLFSQVVDQFFGLVVHINSFIELVILSRQSGEELIRCNPRSGTLKLV
ncbi:type VI secretion system baseplate subunit TssF [Massilia sp. DWR3-1-1]|uniref:type VI secretion system baseplate subunit TssF n=1 Tax=Massilia sp. DWR3-1-1 TaxID=2804559 RepID=UPI003CF0C7F8